MRRGRAEWVDQRRGGLGGKGADSCKEDNLCLYWVKGEAAGRTPCDKTVKGVLNPIKEDGRVRPAAKNRTVVSKSDTKGGPSLMI